MPLVAGSENAREQTSSSTSSFGWFVGGVFAGAGGVLGAIKLKLFGLGQNQPVLAEVPVPVMPRLPIPDGVEAEYDSDDDWERMNPARNARPPFAGQGAFHPFAGGSSMMGSALPMPGSSVNAQLELRADLMERLLLGVLAATTPLRQGEFVPAPPPAEDPMIPRARAATPPPPEEVAGPAAQTRVTFPDRATMEEKLRRAVGQLIQASRFSSYDGVSNAFIAHFLQNANRQVTAPDLFRAFDASVFATIEAVARGTEANSSQLNILHRGLPNQFREVMPDLLKAIFPSDVLENAIKSSMP